MTLHAPQARPPSTRAVQLPEQHSLAAVQEVPSDLHAVQSPCAEHWPEQQSAPVLHMLALPVWMQLAQWPVSQTSPVQQLELETHEDPCPPQFWHAPPSHTPLQHSVLVVHAPDGVQLRQVVVSPTAMQEPSQQPRGSDEQVLPRGMQLAHCPFTQWPEQHPLESTHGPPSGDPRQRAGPHTKPPSLLRVQLPPQQSLSAEQSSPSARQPPHRKAVTPPSGMPPSTRAIGPQTWLQQSEGVAQLCPSGAH
jgi:hypothetical protein